MSWTMEFFDKVTVDFIVAVVMIISHSEAVCRNLAIKRMIEGEALVNHTVDRIQPVDDHFHCARTCYMEQSCFSYNVCEDHISGSLCELLDSDHIRHGEHLVEKAGCTYYGSETSCSSNPCVSNATCQGDFSGEDKPYRCVCPRGFTGQNCEIEINECLTGDHLCHANATCSNMIGGHECTCKTGFYGDGIQCNDEDECTNGTHDCHVNAACSNVIGGYRCTCKTGFLGNGSFCQRPKSCEELKLLLPNKATSGTYDHQLEGGGVASVFCSYESYSECGAGPWTLAMKIDGALDNFKYDSVHWRQKSVFNSDGSVSGLDDVETVSPAYWSTPLTKLCLGMKYEDVLNWILINVEASSLYDIMANQTNITTNLGEAKWRSLLPKTSLQLNCNMEGFNLICEEKVLPTQRRLRLGYFNNQEPDCKSCNSYVGFGPTDGSGSEPVCGNYGSPSGADNGDLNIPAFCYILIH